MPVFCIAVDKSLDTEVCPLSKGACYWQHRETKACCYTELDLAVNEYCDLVGAPLPTKDLDAFMDELRDAV